jgi:TRAP-type C4-dicarboxylate transport system substrate-binding protein
MFRSAVCVLTASLALAACGGHDKAGGAAASGTPTIEIVTQNGSPHYLSAYVRAVGRDAEVPTRVKVHTSYRSDEAEGDAAIFRDVRDGRVDFGLVSARGLDTVGVDAFTSMLAPLAIDSLEAQQRVLEGELPSRALAALAGAGVVGVAALPGDLRHPLGITRRLVRPSDFAGATIGIRSSALARRTFEQLGATVVLNRGDTYPGVDGIESDLTLIVGDEADRGAESLAVDLALWPRIFVVLANPKAWEALDPARRKALSDGSRAALPAAIEVLRARDAESYDVLCRSGHVRLTRTTPADADALRRALEPVTNRLDNEALAEIAHARAAVGTPPAHPPCRPPPRVTEGPATPIDGVWTFDSDVEDSVALGVEEDEVSPDNVGRFVLTFSRGRFTITNEFDGECGWVYGTYEVDGQRMTWDVTDGWGPETSNRPGERFVYDWSRFKDTLRLEPVPGEISPWPMLVKPWRRIGDDPRRAPHPRDCGLPADAHF